MLLLLKPSRKKVFHSQFCVTYPFVCCNWNLLTEKPAGDEKRYETVGEQFTEIFIKFPDNVGLILSLLDESSFRVRWSAVKLLSNLTINKLVYQIIFIVVCDQFLRWYFVHRPKEVQEIILISPMGVSKLMDLLSENREVIRNDVSLEIFVVLV